MTGTQKPLDVRKLISSFNLSYPKFLREAANTRDRERETSGRDAEAAEAGRADVPPARWTRSAVPAGCQGRLREPGVQGVLVTGRSPSSSASCSWFRKKLQFRSAYYVPGTLTCVIWFNCSVNSVRNLFLLNRGGNWRSRRLESSKWKGLRFKTTLSVPKPVCFCFCSPPSPLAHLRTTPLTAFPFVKRGTKGRPRDLSPSQKLSEPMRSFWNRISQNVWKGFLSYVTV